MQRSLVVLALWTTAAGAQPAAPVCLPVDKARVEATAAEARNADRFDKALDKKRLALVTLDVVVVEEPPAGLWKPLTVMTTESGGKPVRWLVGPQTRAPCGFDAKDWLLAKNAKGELYSITKVARFRGASYLTACGCRTYERPTCGGAAPRPIAVRYRLPDGVTYAGGVTIEYDADPSNVLFTEKAADGKACPPPPPPPP
jgi:hypothetical protein